MKLNLKTDLGASGTGDVDDSEALIEGIDALPSEKPNQGGIIDVPQGIYRLDQEVHVSKPNVVFTGSCMHSINESLQPSYGPWGSSFLINHDGIGIDFYDPSRLTHHGPVITGVNFSSINPLATCVRVKEMNHAKFDMCAFRGGHVGLDINGEDNDAGWWAVRECNFHGNRTSLRLYGLGLYTGGWIRMEQDEVGIHIRDESPQVRIIGAQITGFKGKPNIGILNEAGECQIIGNDFENIMTQVKLNYTGAQNSGKKNIVSLNNFNGSGLETGIEVTKGATATTILGNAYTHMRHNVIDDSAPGEIWRLEHPKFLRK